MTKQLRSRKKGISKKYVRKNTIHLRRKKSKRRMSKRMSKRRMSKRMSKRRMSRRMSKRRVKRNMSKKWGGKSGPYIITGKQQLNHGGKLDTLLPYLMSGNKLYLVRHGFSCANLGQESLKKSNNPVKLAAAFREFKGEYDKWADENNHLPKLQTSEQIIEKFKQQWEDRKKQQQWR